MPQTESHSSKVKEQCFFLSGASVTALKIFINLLAFPNKLLTYVTKYEPDASKHETYTGEEGVQSQH